MSGRQVAGCCFCVVNEEGICDMRVVGCWQFEGRVGYKEEKGEGTTTMIVFSLLVSLTPS